MMDLRLPSIAGTDREQLAQIRSYLYQLIPQLQWILDGVEKTLDAQGKISAAVVVEGGEEILRISVSDSDAVFVLEATRSGIAYKKNGTVIWKK